VNGAGEVWFVLLSSTRPDPALVTRVGMAKASRKSILTIVPGEDESETRVLELADLPAGELSLVGVRHVKGAKVVLSDMLAAARGPVVLAPGDRIAQLVSGEVVQVLDHVVAASSLDGALRVAAMLEMTGDVEEILHPPGFSVALSVADAGIGRSPDAETLVTVDHGPGSPDVPWLTVRGQDLEVRTQGMSKSNARAVIARQGRRRRVVEDSPRRLLLGPANAAGQGGEWARAVREHAPGWTARNLQVVRSDALLVFGSDFPLTHTEWANPATRVDLAVELVVGATDIVVEAMRPLLAVGDGGERVHAWDTRRAREDIGALQASGRNVALLFHGSEVRRPSIHARLTPWSPFYRAETATLTADLERTTDRVHEAFGDFEGPLLVSTPDLLDHVPGAAWLPVVVGAASFVPAPPALTRPRLVVAHAPSRSWLKGSQWVDPVLERMEREGLLTYRRLEYLPAIMIPSFLSEVDVLVDQIVLGNPGVLAAQAMAAGRLVLSHLPESVRRRFPEPPPVVETTPATLEQVLLSVIENPEHYRQVADRGVGFARKYHDGQMSARVLTEALG
jgi:hypothetical protein